MIGIEPVGQAHKAAHLRFGRRVNFLDSKHEFLRKM
jgi:hypothetical protein